MSGRSLDFPARSFGSPGALEADSSEMPEKRGVSLRRLLHILFKRKWLVLTCFVVCSVTAVALIVLLLSKPLYLATSQLLISPARELVSAGPSGGSAPPWLGFNAVEQTAWTVEMLKGRFLAERVVQAMGHDVLYPSSPEDKLDLLGIVSSVWPIGPPARDEQTMQEEAVRTFLKNVDAKPAGRSSIVELSFRHENPELAARVVTLLSEMYVERHLGVQRNAETDEFFQEQVVALKNKVANSQEEIRAFKQRHGITGSVGEEKDIAMQQLISLRADLKNLRSDQPQLETRVDEIRRQLAKTTRTPAQIEQLRAKLTALEIQENELAMRMTARHPTLLAARREVDTLRRKLNALEADSEYGISTGESLHATLEAELLHNEAEVKALRAREAAQTARLAEFQRRVDALERIQPEFRRLQNELEMDERNYRLYLTKFEESRIARAMDAQKITGVRVIEEARPPTRPIDSRRGLKILAGIVGSAFAAVALAFVVNGFDESLDTAHDVETVLELPVLASIPELKSQRGNPRLLAPGERHGAIALRDGARV